MALIRGKRSGLVSPFFRQGLIPGGGAIKRYFINSDSSVSPYYELATTATVNGNFKIDYTSTTAGVAMNFADGFGVDASGNSVEPASVTDVLVNGVSVGLGGTIPLDGKLNTIEFVGAVAEAVTMLGQNGVGANFFDGILANAVTNNGLVTTTFKLDEPTANAENSAEGNNSLTYNNITTSDRERYQLTTGNDHWLNISTEPQELPAIITVYGLASWAKQLTWS